MCGPTQRNSFRASGKRFAVHVCSLPLCVQVPMLCLQRCGSGNSPVIPVPPAISFSCLKIIFAGGKKQIFYIFNFEAVGYR